MKKSALLFATILLLFSACTDKLKESLGITETMPDEYQIQRNKSLEIPPAYKPQTKSTNTTKNTLSKAEQKLLKEAQ